MKKILFFLFASAYISAAQTPIYMVPPDSIPSSLPQDAAARAAAQKGTGEIMIISPIGRAKDLQSAIQYLKQLSPISQPIVKLTDGTEITSITSVDMMPEGTILIFKVNSLKGMQYKVVNIEDVDRLIHGP